MLAIRQWSDRLTHLLGRLHLIYLSLLPALATFAILASTGSRHMFLVFFGGIVSVAVYLAFLVSYVPPPSTLGRALLVLVDGPLFVLLAFRRGAPPLGLTVSAYLVDGLAVWLAILWLALRSPLPTPGQRVGSVLFMLLAAGSTLALCWPYLTAARSNSWLAPLILAAGLVEALVAHETVLRREELVRDAGSNLYALILPLIIWLVALCVGAVLHDAGVQLTLF